MGKDFVGSSPLAREYFERADKALGFSLSEICFNGPEETLTLTKHAQPAILTVSIICYELLKASFEFTLVGAAGHSLGEYAALVAAGALSFEDAVVLVHKRGTFMQEAVAPGVGKMAAILGKDREWIAQACGTVSSGTVEVANDNAPGQVVISGDRVSVDNAIAAMAPVKAIELPVSAPFHCSLMQPAADRLKVEISKVSISPATAPVIANVSATAVQHPDEIRAHLIEQVCGTVRWVESMQSGLAMLPSATCVEFGSGTTLAGLMKRIAPTVRVCSLNTPKSIEDFVASHQNATSEANVA
jgi:[acyl-carrier-protein] S-malonyltransferase